jgi:hypothetical protein
LSAIYNLPISEFKAELEKKAKEFADDIQSQLDEKDAHIFELNQQNEYQSKTITELKEQIQQLINNNRKIELLDANNNYINNNEELKTPKDE